MLNLTQTVGKCDSNQVSSQIRFILLTVHTVYSKIGFGAVLDRNIDLSDTRDIYVFVCTCILIIFVYWYCNIVAGMGLSWRKEVMLLMLVLLCSVLILNYCTFYILSLCEKNSIKKKPKNRAIRFQFECEIKISIGFQFQHCTSCKQASDHEVVDRVHVFA